MLSNHNCRHFVCRYCYKIAVSCLCHQNTENWHKVWCMRGIKCDSAYCCCKDSHLPCRAASKWPYVDNGGLRRPSRLGGSIGHVDSLQRMWRDICSRLYLWYYSETMKTVTWAGQRSPWAPGIVIWSCLERWIRGLDNSIANALPGMESWKSRCLTKFACKVDVCP